MGLAVKDDGNTCFAARTYVQRLDESVRQMQIDRAAHGQLLRAGQTMHRMIQGLFALFLLLFAAQAHAAVLPVTGALRTVAGGPVADGNYVVFVGLYDAKDAVKPAWSAAYKAVAVQQGLFALELGDPNVAALDDSLLTSGKLWWIGIAIASDPELSRVPLRPAAQAVFAQLAGAVSFPYAGAKAMGGNALGLDCSGCVTVDMLADNSITAGKLAFNYAGSASKGGPATSAIAAQTAVNAENAASADEAKSLACSGCVQLGALSAAAVATFYPSKGGVISGDGSVNGNWTVNGTSKLAGGVDLANSAISGGHFVALDILSAPCAAGNAGQVAFDNKTKRLFLCDGTAYLRISVCGGKCKLANEVACGQPIATDCGDIVGCVGTGTLCGSGSCSNGSCKNVGDAQDSPGKSCKDIIAKNPAAKTGTFWIDPNSTGAYQVDCDMAISGGGWVRLLKNVPRYGNQQASAKSLADGSFGEFRAVHLNGFISCNCGIANQNYPWQACASPGNEMFSFELLKNGAYIVQQQVNYSVLPTQCAKPATPTGDILCTVNFSTKKNDDLTPTWSEPSTNQSLSDNCGTQYIDVWAR